MPLCARLLPFYMRISLSQNRRPCSVKQAGAQTAAVAHASASKVLTVLCFGYRGECFVVHFMSESWLLWTELRKASLVSLRQGRLVFG